MMWTEVVGGGGEDETTRHGGAVGRSTCWSNKGPERAWVDIRAWGVGGEVVAAGAGFGYCRIIWGKKGFWGGVTGRGKRTRFSSKGVI